MKRLIMFSAMMVVGMSVFSQTTETKSANGHEWRVRLRGVGVMPQESADISVIKGDVDISNSFIPELDFTYFFNSHFAAELILGTTRHKVSTRFSDLTAIGGADAANIDLGKVWLLPPTLTLQYHYPVGKFNPYVGAGINYTIFYSADQGPVVKNIEYKNKFAFAAQAGFDYDISKRLFINVDLKKIFLSTTATVDASNLTPAGSPQLAPVLSNIQADVKINPWLLGVGIGCKF
ncbi:OmpW/AlkL family protein [Pedobacter sp. MR2016-24]|uniref:OmpW/AlkL family protein n=1 Tax=Pedobacter sp. MR2016-24 TaxID=2994466 RepID=UPI00224806D3|nr:OmpW family outer membrane protein [Pedobacter sp. MR2016-24]MCX2482743.1 outer membrane beta-barrel protein [Pedobacter sp. MR2016-24]